MSKILLSFYNGLNDPLKIPVLYEGLINSLTRNGNEVRAVSANTLMNCTPADVNGLSDEIQKERLIEDIRSMKLDFVIAFNNCIPIEILRAVDCPVLIWEADASIYFNNKEELRRNPGRYFWGAASTHSLRDLEEKFRMPSERMLFLPFATDLRARDLPQETNISFIGSYFGGGYFIKEYMAGSDYADNRELVRILEYLGKHPFCSLAELSAEFKVTDSIAEHFSTGHLHSLVSNGYRANILNEISALGLRLYGPSAWDLTAFFSYELALSYDRTPVYSMEDNERVYNSSKICINISHIQAVDGLPWRIRDIMATNGCLVSDRQNDLSVFSDFVDIPVYDDRYEARRICERLLADDDERRGIVAASQRAIDSGHRFEHRFKDIEDLTGIRLLNGETRSGSSVAGATNILDPSFYHPKAESEQPGAPSSFPLPSADGPAFPGIFDPVEYRVAKPRQALKKALVAALSAAFKALPGPVRRKSVRLMKKVLEKADAK